MEYFANVPLSASSEFSRMTMGQNSTTSKPRFVDKFTCYLCGNKNEGLRPISSKYGDFTICFDNLLLAVVALFMIVFGSSHIKHLRKQPAVYKYRKNWILYGRLTLTVVSLLFAFSILQFSKSATNFQVQEWITIGSLIVALALTTIDYAKTPVTNGILLFYWLLEFVFQTSTLINIVIRHSYEHVWFNSSKSFMIMTLLLASSSGLNLLIHCLPQKSMMPYQEIQNYHHLQKKNPYDSADIFSRISFSWMTDMMRTGYEKFLDESDLYKLPVNFNSDTISKDIFSNINKYPNSLTLALLKTFGSKIALAGFFKVLHDMLAFVQPQLLKIIINFVTQYNDAKDKTKIPIVKGFLYAFYMFVVGFVQTCVLHQYFLLSFNSGMNVKSGMISVIYQKSLKLSNEASSMSSTGDIVNLMSVDVQRLQDLNQWGHIIWSGPFQLLLCLVSLYKLLGNCMWVGVLIMAIMIPINSIVVKVQKSLQRQQMKNKDERTSVISEILNNIKSLKLYAWEVPYKAKLDYVRNEKELKNLKKMGIVQAFTNFQFNMVPFLVSCSTFAVFILTNHGKPLSTDLVFPALSLFNLLSFPLNVIPMVITSFVEASVSINRLTKFLRNEELQENCVTKLPKVEQNGEVTINLKDCTFLWRRHPEYTIALNKINFQARKGQLHCIVGRVGSGKSALIQAVLGDLYRVEGDASVAGKIAYVSQVSWIMNGTVKENILFGHKYDDAFYQKTIKACALNTDLQVLPDGDQTFVGEKGISLSGGQKARISLARAVYARADVYLLDDPLAAVDEHVSKHLIDHVLGSKGLLCTKTKVLVTNKISCLNISDSITLLEKGSIVEQSSFSEIMLNNSKKEGSSTSGSSQLFKLIKEYGKKESKSEESKSSSDSNDELADEINEIPIPENEVTPDAQSYEEILEKKSLRRASNATLKSIGFFDDQEHDQDQKQASPAAMENRKEFREVGKVKWGVYLEYAKACNPKYVCLFLFFLVANVGLSVSGNIWLKHWSEINTKYGGNPHFAKYLSIYFAFGVGSAAATLVSVIILWMFCTINGSKLLHDGMSACVLKAPMSFFETTPIGRILNRFSNDIYKVDEILGRTFAQFFMNVIKVSFTIFVITYTTWQFLFLILPLLGLYVYYQQYYLRTSRELRRLDSTTRSPIFAHFQETLGGISTIKGFDQTNRFVHLNQCKVDNNMSAFYPSVNANRWLAFRLETIGSIIIFGAATLGMYRLKTGSLTSGMIGLSLSYALQITQSLNWIVRMTVEVETNIVSVERIKEYSTLPQEKPSIIPEHRPPTSAWPQKGCIEFSNYSTRYREGLPLILKNIDLKIEPKEKIGIVGRTGAGKSSLTLALFRLIEKAEGSIVIDGVKIDEIGLYDLRSHLSIIPQDSQVFEGTVRENLDPTHKFEDAEIWKALELSHLKEHITSMGSGLESLMTEGGGNMSVGQRQLMCLARALLIPSKILVLDEATAAVDVETDQVIQQTIRTAFKDRTILTIAHRLNTIMDSDRIIVLDQGKVKEFDSPANLLKAKTGIFYSLCAEGGLVDA